MGTYTNSGHLKFKDEKGNVYILLPITTVDNVQGAVPMTAAGLAGLLSTGPMVLVEGVHYGTEFPAEPVEGQVFLLKV